MGLKTCHKKPKQMDNVHNGCRVYACTTGFNISALLTAASGWKPHTGVAYSGLLACKHAYDCVISYTHVWKFQFIYTHIHTHIRGLLETNIRHIVYYSQTRYKISELQFQGIKHPVFNSIPGSKVLHIPASFAWREEIPDEILGCDLTYQLLW
jgi:hypothetical protein